jgi:hypothetical protein
MKRLLAALLTCAWSLTAQDPPAGQLMRLSVPTASTLRPVSVTALNIERGPDYPSIIHLKGSVEIKTPICVLTGPNNEQSCSGYVVLRADEADLHEESGQIDARGNVTVTREK